MIKPTAFLLAALVPLTAVETSAQAVSSLPKLEIEKLCRTRANSISSLGVGLADPFKICIEAEQKARDALVKSWKDIPQSYKAHCIRPKDYSPSYAEWIACLELNMDVKKLRTKQ